MRFHWFANDLANISRDKFRQKISELDSLGYYSVLLPYHIFLSDNFILAAQDLSPNERIKYNIAIRYDSMTPEQCARMTKAFHDIGSNRLMLNIIFGSQVEKGLRFVEDLLKNPLLDKTNTQIVIASHSEEALELSSRVAYASLTDLYTFDIQSPDTDLGILKLSQIKQSKRVMLSADIVINQNHIPGPSIIQGTEDEVAIIIKDLSSRGVTDLLVSNHELDRFPDRTHEFLKNYRGS
jgi:alkanesulfonate monooxygenase SsuD/methylene tetrahydromethanopterin reductase-like flavin-dependent oxidoreductase (luciferase family)